MTIKERDAMPDRQRIKQFLEYSIRRFCDDATDIPENVMSTSAMEKAVKLIKDLSEIYKNMGYDRGGQQNDM